MPWNSQPFRGLLGPCHEGIWTNWAERDKKGYKTLERTQPGLKHLFLDSPCLVDSQNWRKLWHTYFLCQCTLSCTTLHAQSVSASGSALALSTPSSRASAHPSGRSHSVTVPLARRLQWCRQKPWWLSGEGLRAHWKPSPCSGHSKAGREPWLYSLLPEMLACIIDQVPNTTHLRDTSHGSGLPSSQWVP